MANERNNKRPTASSILNIVTFCTALLAVGGLSIFMEKPTYSEQEKRDLASSLNRQSRAIGMERWLPVLMRFTAIPSRSGMR